MVTDVRKKKTTRSVDLLQPVGHSPRDVSVLNKLGYFYDHSGDGRRAVAFLEEAIVISTGFRHSQIGA
jgi:hypothetical protein